MEDKILGYIENIAKRLGQTHRFDIYDQDDIKQEIYFLVVQAQEEFNEDRGDEYTFYFNYVKNRLSNFRRDNYSHNVYKMGISNAASLEGDVVQAVDSFIESYRTIIDNRVDASFRADYLRYKEGVKLSHKRKIAVINHIKEIVERARKNEEVSYANS